MKNYMICVRNVKKKNNVAEFGNEPGTATFLEIPEDATDFSPRDIVASEKTWLTHLLAGKTVKNILVYIHGYDMNRPNTLYRHNVLKKGLAKYGWDGEVVTFAWPSGTQPLLYWEDRFDALKVAYQLVDKGIKLFVNQVQAGCTVNVHLIAHSTGALIVRESFYISRTIQTRSENNWAASQVVFIAGDVSSKSMEGELSDEIYRHCARLTNYFSNYDSILAISNAKRVGMENRVGRVGLPPASPEKAVDVNCSTYYKTHENSFDVVDAFKPHSWYFWSDKFLEDLVYTLNGDLDRNVIPTRTKDQDGELWLTP